MLPRLWSNLRWIYLALHVQGQVTTLRLTVTLTSIGIEISKRQVVRLLTTELERFVEEDNAILHTGRNAYTTQIGGERFSAFRTSFSKSRLNFLSILKAGHQNYILNDEAMNWLRTQGAEQAIVEKLKTRPTTDQVAFLEYLTGRDIDIFDRQPMCLLVEAGSWGMIRHHGLLGNTVIVSDDAGQFRVGSRALCWIHCERLLQKLMPAKRREVRRGELIRDLVWRFYKALKTWKLKPSPQAAHAFRRRFDRIFSSRTGYDVLDKRLVRLHRRRHELLKVLEHPDIPLHTNASENDLRTFVTKRKISEGTMSFNGRIARDTMLGLMKTCQKLGISFYVYLGDRLGLDGDRSKMPRLAELVAIPN